MKVRDVHVFLRALRQTGVLDPHPVRAALTLLLDVARHGPSLYAVVRWQARRHPDAPAIASGAKTLTYRVLLERADAIASDLHSAHRTLRRVGIVDANPLGTLLALLACDRLGWHAVPITSRLGVEGVRAVQTEAGLDVLLCPEVLLEEYPGAHPIRHALHPPAPRRRASAGQLGLLTSGSTARPRVIRR